MNIAQAKDQIKYAIKSYFTKDENGDYVIPIERQRPIFLMGPPGVGKTAIMEQIASELNVGIVSYSMTHHTRQSALGLPFISKKKYGDKEYSVSEYTMSEIIASVYDRIEEDGIKEGILFLDEINCVSETLAPSMLQFLQYKVFGTHRVPDGWIVVTAGNPPEYNNSVREFDIVTWDRLKRIDVEPDYGVWKKYAYVKNVHPAIISFLDIKKDCFYSIETTVDGKRFVTARGWVDLSDMIRLYESNGFKIDDTLVIQYLQNPKVAREFSTYYDLFKKYKSDYEIDSIINGTVSDKIISRAKKAKFDERLSLLGLIYDHINNDVKDVGMLENVLTIIQKEIKDIKLQMTTADVDKIPDILLKKSAELEKETDIAKRSKNLSKEDIRCHIDASKILNQMANTLKNQDIDKRDIAFTKIKKVFEDKKETLKKQVDVARKHIDNSLSFLEKAYGPKQELTIIVTELTSNYDSAYFISHYGSEQYFRFNKELLINERQIELQREIENIELEGII